MDLDAAGDFRPHVPGPMPQPAVQFRPRLLLRECRAHRVCHHHGPGHCQLLIGKRSAMDLLSFGQKHQKRVYQPDTCLGLCSTDIICAAFCLGLPPHSHSFRARVCLFRVTDSRVSRQQPVRVLVLIRSKGKRSFQDRLAHSTRRQQTRRRRSPGILLNGDGPGGEARPFLPRFPLLETVSAHSPYVGLEPSQPRLQGNLLCRKNCLQL